MRALVISDTHFGAWTGEDLLRHDHESCARVTRPALRSTRSTG